MDSNVQSPKRGPGRPPKGDRAKTRAEIELARRMKRKSEGLVRARFWISEDLRDRLTKIAESNDSTIGKLLEQALRRELSHG